MNSYDPIGMDSNRSSVIFIVLVVIAQFIGAAAVLLTGFWLGTYWEGYSWSDPKKLFNYHPLFMVLGFVFLYGDAILVYRVFGNCSKPPIKILHGILHIMAFMFAVTGVKAVYDMHEISNIPHFYSIHSWLGLVVLTIFALQWLFGITMFFIPKVPNHYRKNFLPIHVSFGSLVYLLVLGVCIAGITEKNFFAHNYSSLGTGELMGNVVGVFIVAFGGMVYFLVSHPVYRRVEAVSPERIALQEQK